MMTHRFAITSALTLALLAPVLPAVAQDGTTRTRRVSPTVPSQTTQGAPTSSRKQKDPTTVVPDDADPITLTTEVVNVLFTVTDQKNRFVPNLQQGDLVVTEDGVKQDVFSFKHETSLPLTVAILVDISSSQEFTFDDEKRAAMSFLQRVLRPRQDTAAIVSFREDVEWVQGLTSRLDRVNDAFNRLKYDSLSLTKSRSGATAFYDAVGVTANELFGEQKATDDPASIKRRAIIVLTDGADTASDRTIQDAVNEALRADAIVYTIGIGDRYRSTAVKRDVLELMAEQTGGRAYFPNSYDDLNAAFKQIDLELRSQYLIAYEPTNPERDGTFRTITIQLPGRGDVKIFHRKGYYAPKGDAAPVKKGPVIKP